MNTSMEAFLNTDGSLQRMVRKFIYDPPPTNTDHTTPIYCLGTHYSSDPPPPPSENPSDPEAAAASTWPADFLSDFESQIWMTYRESFPAIPRPAEKGSQGMTFMTQLRSHLPQHAAGFTDDQGWGCMIRSAQCVLANALVKLHLGASWRRGEKTEEEKKILQLFADDPRAPFSIHRFVEHGSVACGTPAGEWFGPSAASRCIAALSNEYAAAGLRVYMTGDGGDVYEDKFRRIAEVDGVVRPTLVLIGIRLGIERVTPVYYDALKKCLMLPQSVGIAGGRPASSHYFTAVQGSTFFYLDPHFCRPALPYHDSPGEYTQAEIDSCHTRRLRRLPMNALDPSMMLAFLIRDEEDWRKWRGECEAVEGKKVVSVLDTEIVDTPREGAEGEVESDEEGLQ